MQYPRFVYIAMSTFLLSSILGLSLVHQPCAVWREIAPCTCKLEYSRVSINCEKMESFGEVIDLLQNKFASKDRIILRIAYSNLDDLAHRSFKELNMTIEDLKLHHDDISALTPYSFSGLQQVTYLSLADNPIPYMPVQIFDMMTKIRTLDIGRLRLKNVPKNSFRNLPQLETLVLPGNMLHHIDTHAIPTNTVKLHLAKNSLKDLNGTLRHLTELQWLFINGNELTTLDEQLPKNGLKIKMLHAANNRIEKLPYEIRSYPNLDKLFLQYNQINSLDGAIAKSRKLEHINLERNRISILLPDDFAEAENLCRLELQFNYITTLNSSLMPLKKLRIANLSQNLLTEFSWQEIRGLQNLRTLDLSFNKIRRLTGQMPNLVEWETKLTTLKLEHNELQSLDGGLSGLRSLLRLNLSYNSLSRISPDDLIGLDQLTMLDISHNKLTTLEETSKTFLPNLQELIASHNYLTVLDKDFHGLPVLCWADLSNNMIVALGRDLVSKTHCRIPDGVYEDKWGTLSLYLKDNPILCDAALPEITSAMEVNHTRIVGVSHCPPLSEQPVTSKPNGFLGYIPEPIAVVAQNEQIYTNNLRENIHDSQNLQELAFAKANQVDNNNHQTIRHNHYASKVLEPLPYQNTAYQSNNEPLHVHLPLIEDEGNGHDPYVKRSSDVVTTSENQSFRSTNENNIKVKLAVTELPLNEQPIYNMQEEISQLASEIEHLKTRVQALTSENERLAKNLQTSQSGEVTSEHVTDSTTERVI